MRRVDELGFQQLLSEARKAASKVSISFGPDFERIPERKLRGRHLAAGAEAAKPSSRQLTDWFWNETATGAAIHVLREVLQAHEDERLRLIVSNFVVPAARVRGG